jgi:hypothetical protein
VARAVEAPQFALLDSAAERIREMAKWLLAAFGAVGVVVVAGVALSDLGDIADPSARWSAVGAAILALVGVVTAVLAAGSIVTRSFVTLTDVAADTKSPVTDEVLLTGLDNAEALKDEYVKALRLHRESADALFRHASTRPAAGVTQDDHNAWSDVLSERADAAAARVTFYDGIVRVLLSRQSFLNVSRAYEKAKLGMAAGAIVSVVGILLFVFATTEPDGAPVVGTTPAGVVVSIRPRGEGAAHAALGERCDLRKLMGTAIATEGDRILVAVPKSASCRSAILRLSPAQAVVRHSD